MNSATPGAGTSEPAVGTLIDLDFGSPLAPLLNTGKKSCFLLPKCLPCMFHVIHQTKESTSYWEYFMNVSNIA